MKICNQDILFPCYFYRHLSVVLGVLCITFHMSPSLILLLALHLFLRILSEFLPHERLARDFEGLWRYLHFSESGWRTKIMARTAKSSANSLRNCNDSNDSLDDINTNILYIFNIDIFLCKYGIYLVFWLNNIYIYFICMSLM